MPRVKRAVIVLALAIAAVLTATPRAFAVTVDQIVQLTKAGISEPVILALIDRDHNILAIDPEQIVTLKQEGVSDSVLIAMLKSGRAESEAALRAESAANDAAILRALTTEPELIIVGHGPEIPNGGSYTYTPRYVDNFSGVITLPVPAPYLSPYATPALLIQSASCVPLRGSPTPCAPPLRRGRNTR